MVQTTVLSVSTTFLTLLMTTAAALASKPVVGSSTKMMEGLATSSMAMVSRLRCSVDGPLTPGMPTKASFTKPSSTVSRTSATNSYAKSENNSFNSKVILRASPNALLYFISNLANAIFWFRIYHQI